MITFIQGTLEENWPGLIVVNANGVGYQIVVPLAGEDAFGKIDNQANILKNILYGLGAIYSIIIFVLCFASFYSVVLA